MPFTSEGGNLMPFATKKDRKAFAEVFDLYYPRLCYFANRFVADPDSAEDIVQSVFIKFWEHRRSIVQGSVKAWLYLSTRNAVLNCIKQMQKLESCQEALWEEMHNEHEDFVLNQMVRAEVLQELHNQINALPPKCAEVFRLHMLNDYSYAQIAQQLDISVHTVKNQIMRGKELLRQRMNGASWLTLLIFFPNFFD